MSNATNTGIVDRGINTSCVERGQTYIGFVTTYSLIFIAGLILNLMALIIFFCHTKTRSHTTVYMTNLALSDLLLVCTLPVRIYYHFGLGQPSQKICEVAGLILLANMYGSILLLTCISLDRCLAVCYPLSSRVREGRKKAPLVCLGVWILTIGASLPIYLKTNSNIPPEQMRCFGTFPSYALKTTTLISSLTVGFIMPLVIMILCSWGLLRAINKSTAAQTPDLVDRRKIQRMVSANLAIFLFCFLPYHVMLVVLYFSPVKPEDIPCSVLNIYSYSLMIACLNTTLDPLAYYFTTETFREKVDMSTVRRMWPLPHSEQHSLHSASQNIS